MWLPLLFFTLVSVKADYKFETKWFEVPLDHFGFERNETFKIKYLVNETYWDRGGGPIFFYTGNEGQIEVFAQHTGFMWDIADEFRAKLVFAEHRYYGESMPFGNKSLDNEHIGYLTSSQALADYADLINYLQGDQFPNEYPVVLFGGSYGGMLAAYFRMKYPHLAAGAIAASAPVDMYPGMGKCESFNNIATSAYRIANGKCAENVRRSWTVLRNLTKSANYSATLQKQWRLCDPLKNETCVNKLVDFLTSMYSTLAMVNYPFASDFLVALPGQPVRYVCQFLNQTLDGEALLEGIGKVLDTYTNYDKKNKCVDYMSGADDGNLDASGWNYQACTEMVMPMCATGVHDMFEPSPWNYTTFSNDCHKQFNVYPRPDLARILYGGKYLKAASNIVFSNGLLDPWIAGGITSSVSDTVQSVLIIDGAHHMDLMAHHEKDKDSVKLAREFHKQNIRKWILEFRNQ